jgi:hypothetical protein
MDDYLECPCCGGTAAKGPLYTDGAPTICGCPCWVSCDTETEPYVNGPDQPCGCCEKELNPGYHIKTIERGIFGEPSKIREEVEEFMDAVEQGCSIMALVELSDLIGAIQGYLAKYHKSIKLVDLVRMSSITERAFKIGSRH